MEINNSDYLFNFRYLKFIAPLHKNAGELYIKINGKNKIKVPKDFSGLRFSKSTIVQFASE
jgi:hypothetical protein